MKICIALSGGVDSSVAALLLKRAGYDVFALFMQNWHDTTGTLHGDCEWEEDRFVAEMVARKIGIPFYFVDLSDEYRKRVVDYMFSEYEAGRTPNPDVLCNREIKFDAFLKTAEKLGADMVATGHYCRKDSFRDSGGREIFRILEGRTRAISSASSARSSSRRPYSPSGTCSRARSGPWPGRQTCLRPRKRTPRVYALSARWTCPPSSSRNSRRARETWWRYMTPSLRPILITCAAAACSKAC